jgi:hypothetical protein
MITWSHRMLGGVSWVGVVTAGAVLVWVVISRAGTGLVDESGAVTPPSSSTVSAAHTPSGTGTTGQRGSWQGDQGVVTAACRGPEIALVGAQPEEDVVVNVLDRGPDQLTVAFRAEEGASVTVMARCRDGRPDFDVAPTVSPPAPSPQNPAGSGGDETGGTRDHPGDD